MIKKLLILGILLVGLIYFSTPVYATLGSDPVLEDFDNYNFFGDVWGIRSVDNLVPPNTKQMLFTIPISDYHLFDKLGAESTIVLTDGVDTQIIKFSDLGYISGSHSITFANYTSLEVSAFTINIIQSWESVVGGYVDYINANTSLGYDASLKTVRYMYGSTIYAQRTFTHTPPNLTYMDVLDEDYEFKGWVDITGEYFNFRKVNDSDLSDDGYFYLYAVIVKEYPTLDITPISPNTPDIISNALTYIGFNNSVGKIMIYVVFAILITGGMLWMSLDTMIIIVGNALVFAVFIFMGWLPIYVIVIMSLIFIVGMFKPMTKGG